MAKELEITFICKDVLGFEEVFENTMELIKKERLDVGFKFNESGRKQFDESFPTITNPVELSELED